MDDCRAVCKRRVEGQPEPRRPDLLLVLNSAMHAFLSVPGSGTVSWRTGGGDANSRGCGLGGFQPLSAGHRDTFQHRLRSPAIMRCDPSWRTREFLVQGLVDLHMPRASCRFWVWLPGGAPLLAPFAR